MSQITTIGTIRFYDGGQIENSVTPPQVREFKVGLSPDSQNDVALFFSVSDYQVVTLYVQLLDSAGQAAGDRQEFIVTGLNRYQITKNKDYVTSVTLSASNANGSTTSQPIQIQKADATLQVIEGELISSCLIEKPVSSYNRVNVNLRISKNNQYSIDQVKSITLLSKREDFQSWTSVDLSKTLGEQIIENGRVVGYSFIFQNVQFPRPSIGGFFSFQVKISIENFADTFSEGIKIFYEDITASQVSSNYGSAFPRAEIVDKFTSLRYEVTAKFYQLFALQSNLTYSPPTDDPKQPPTFVYRFLDSEDVAGLNYNDYLILREDGSYAFYYEFNNNKTDGSTKGFMYPASVSDIYPCVLPEVDQVGNSSIVFFWKINDNFYDYNYFKQGISVLTNSFKVKLQCKENGVYVDMMNSSISLQKDLQYQSTTNKFIVKITRDVDILPSKRTLFNQILESDNSTDKVRFVVVEHGVTCSSNFGGSKDYTFDKLLVPPKWNYIAYDKYIPKDANSRKNNKVEIDLTNFCLRGIRLPQNGFSSFDKIQNVRELAVSTAGRYVAIYDLSVAYKIDCIFNGFYKDPIIEGTINSIIIPEIPDDVFLIAPRVKIPEPNLIPLSQGGRQADARVNLDEYGNIRALEMIDPGGGYSLYKNQLDKRKQTFTDFIPTVVTSYRVNSKPTTVVKKALVPVNASFDSSYLMASIEGGIRLNSVSEDSRAMADYLTESQKQQLNEYLSQTLPDEIPATENSFSIYNETEQSQGLIENILDQEWYQISKLYEEKYNNPLENFSISNEDEDPAVAGQSDSSTESSINASEADTTSTSVSTGSDQTSQDGGAWSLFSLNNLPIIPDGSAAVVLSTLSIAPPWLTLLPLAVRRDGERGSGPLPNMLPRAEMFNRIVAAINNLNEVRVIAPYVWLMTSASKSESWAVATDAYSLSEITFNSGGTKIQNNFSVSDSFAAINTSFSVAASRSVGKVEKKTSEVREYGLNAGIYAVSTQTSSSQTFKPRIHPFMAEALPPYMAKSIKRRLLGLVSKISYNCASAQTPISQALGVPVATCASRNGNVFEKPFPSSYPDTTSASESYFNFFDSGGTISATPRGTSRYVGVQIEKVNGYAAFCHASCDDTDIEAIDFTYANMFPATYKL